jgi:hypothetical protein
MLELTLLRRSSLSSIRSRGALQSASLAAAFLASLSAWGCRNQKPAPPQLTRVSVQLPALYALHPAWSDVAELDVLISHAQTLSSAGQSTVAPGNPLPRSPLPTPLSVSGAPLPMQPPSTEGVTRAAETRLKRLRDKLSAHVDRIIERERRDQLVKLAAESAAKKADLTTAANVAPIDAGLTKEERQALRKLQYQEIAFESQVAVLFPPARGVAETNLKRVRGEILAIESKVPRTENQIQANIDKQLADFRQGRIGEIETKLGQRRVVLEQESAKRVGPYEKRVHEHVELPRELSLSTASAAVSVSPEAIVSPEALAAGTRGTLAAPLPTSEALSGMQAQRARLVSYIADDLRRRLAELARLRRWSVSESARPGYVDITSQAASALKAELAASANISQSSTGNGH